jgi:glucokinase
VSRVLAVDIGGTKFAAALVDADATILRRQERLLDDRPDQVLARLIGDVCRGTVDAVGIGSAGPLDPVQGTVSPVNIPAWRDFPLVAAVGSLVPGAPVAIAGDAQCVAIGECWRGATPAGLAVLGVVVSTGVGGGLVLSGRPYTGPTGNAGQIGHITVDPSGPVCLCGNRGCVEAIASGPAMARFALEHGWRPTGAPDARALAADARQGNETARAAFRRGADALALAFQTTAALCDLDAVVVGGGVAQAGAVLFDPVRQALSQRGGLAFARRFDLRASRLGRDAGLLGAASLAFDIVSRNTT